MNRFRGLSATWLKYFACFFMVIDHFAHVWYLIPTTADQFPIVSLWGTLMYLLGRMVFPVFVFFMAEGCRKTHDMKRYLLRLGLFALVAQIPFSLLFQQWGGSVILTFFLGAFAVFCCQKLRPHAGAALSLLPAVALAAATHLLRSDYGWVGVLLVPTLYLCGESRKRQLITLAAGLAVCYLIDVPLQYLSNACLSSGTPFFAALPEILPAYVSQYLPEDIVIYLCSCVGLIPLAFYNGQRGKGSKYFFYLFYPAHLLILYIIARCIA